MLVRMDQKAKNLLQQVEYDEYTWVWPVNATDLYPKECFA